VLYYSLSHGYAQALKLQTSSIILLLNTFHLPSMVGLLIVYRKSIKKMLLLSVAVCCSAVLSLAIGGRTEAIGCLLCLGLIWLMRKKFNVKKLCIFALVAYLLLVVATTVAEVRDVQNRSLGTYMSVFFKQIIGFKVFATAFGELGYNSSSVPFTMYLMQREGVQHYGLSYLAAICNIIPSSLDIFGWLEPLEKYVLLDVWVTDSFKASFGLGFSLVAESYLNFKWLGVVVMFGYGFLLGKLFACDDLKHQNDWKIYVSFALFGALFTLPRRMSIFFVDTFFWCIICVWLAWKVMAILLNKTEKRKNGKTEGR
jgi:oligosaccharide repeat unit polymerase